MRWIARSKRDQNQAAVDPWTVIHFASGLAAGLVEMPYRWLLAAALAYEAVEQVAERRDFGQRFFETSGPESLPNALVDLAAATLGHRLGRAWNRTGRGRRGAAGPQPEEGGESRNSRHFPEHSAPSTR
ncbi:MAG TPA: hypothetical protein VF100_05305 [Thermoanaerobaculia bacterium]